MDRILLYVEPNAHDRDHLVAWAADFVEAITARSDDARPAPELTIGVVADVLNCLEIGMVTLGRSTPRTVEGGERTASPVTLFPFRPTDGDESMTERGNAYECLRELADGGAVEGVSAATTEGVTLPKAQVAFHRALERGAWEIVVALGGSEWSRVAIREWSARNSRTRVVRPLPDEQIRERVDALLRRVEPDAEDNYRQERHLAVRNAVQFAAMLEQLDLEP